MNRTYNISLLLGLALITAGVATYSIPVALIVCGALIIGLTYATASLEWGGR